MQISMIFSQDPSIQHAITLHSILGEGKFSVYHAKITNFSGSDFALKVFPKNESGSSHFVKEKQFLSTLSHPNIISYISINQHTIPHYVLATEYTPNGDFFDFVTRQQSAVSNEKLMRTYFHQLIDGLEYLHAQGVAHLDLKLDNLLLDRDFNLKILDFDQAQFASDNQLRTGGTEGYRAPELINRKGQNLKAMDIYAAGVLLYTFMLGEMPFVEDKNKKVSRCALYEMFRDSREMFWREKAKVMRKAYSQELKELLTGMWEVDPAKRMRVEDVKRSKWYNKDVYDNKEQKRVVSMILRGF